jgi:hypothetical protein
MAGTHPAFERINYDRAASHTDAKRTWVHHGWYRMHPRQHADLLRSVVSAYGEDPEMRVFVAGLLRTSGVAPREYTRQAAYLLAWVQQNIYYTNEPGECIQSPWFTIRNKTGDCDDLAILLATFYDCIGLEYKFAMAGKAGGRPVRWVEGEWFDPDMEIAHIYVIVGTPALNPNTWYPAEPTVKGLELGWDVVLHGTKPGLNWGEDLGGRQPGPPGNGQNATPQRNPARLLPGPVSSVPPRPQPRQQLAPRGTPQGMLSRIMPPQPTFGGFAYGATPSTPPLYSQRTQQIVQARNMYEDDPDAAITRGGFLARFWYGFDGVGLMNATIQAIVIASVLGYLDRRRA